MKKTILAGILLAGMALVFAPANAAHAKEIPGDGKIPLTSEYFPDQSFLKYEAMQHDKNKDGFLSPEEIEAVTEMTWDSDLSDFSQIRYFTNLRELSVEPLAVEEETIEHGVWLGDEIDLTIFQNLERVKLSLDSRRSPTGAPAVRIKVAGLAHLKSFCVSDMAKFGMAKQLGPEGSGADARIETIDFRGTKVLEDVEVRDTAGVLFDSENQIKRIFLNRVAKISAEQICGSESLESLVVQTDDPDFTRINVTGNDALSELWLQNDHLTSVELAGADALRKVTIVSDALQNIDLSQNPALTSVWLECPKLKKLNVAGNTALKSLHVESDRLATLDLTKNTKLETLAVTSGKITSLNLKKNKKLNYLSVHCTRLTSLDISANTKLHLLAVYGTPLKRLDLSKQKLLRQLSVSDNKNLSKLDLSKNAQILTLCVKNTALSSLDLSKQAKLYYLEITGNKKLTKLDLSKNKALSVVIVSNNALKVLKLRPKAKINFLTCSKNKLTALDLSGAKYLERLKCDKKVKVKGYKGQIIRV